MHRKVVTVLFCDVVGSTALGESVDPEALQGLLARYFERMKAIVESHGGTVEKFIGDAVMAVFGVPAVHEDDALRACRAAVEMRDGIPGARRPGADRGEHGRGRHRHRGAARHRRRGQRRRPAAAGGRPGEILIGEATLELVRSAVETRAGRAARAEREDRARPAHSASSRCSTRPSAPRARASSAASARSSRRRGVGARPSRAALRALTIVGEAGLGKSRLVAEALAGSTPGSSAAAASPTARASPTGRSSRWSSSSTPSLRPAAAAAIRSLLGETDGGTSAEEIAWAFRKLLEEQAPLVVVLDDIQWGEETFLDLVEAAALLSRVRRSCSSAWRGPSCSRGARWPVAIGSSRSPDQAVEELIGDLPAELRERIAAAAGGNPLFLTEMLAMAEARRRGRRPADAARAARGPPRPARRSGALPCSSAAPSRESCSTAAPSRRSPDEPQVTPRLAALSGGLIRPDRAQLPGDDGFRFRHLLIRDAAYDALPKATRAELHERFADWLEERGPTGRARRDPRLPLRAGGPLQGRAGPARRGARARAGASLGRAAGPRSGASDGARPPRCSSRALDLLRPLRIDVQLELDLAVACAMQHDERHAAEGICRRRRQARARRRRRRWCGRRSRGGGPVPLALFLAARPRRRGA